MYINRNNNKEEKEAYSKPKENFLSGLSSELDSIIYTFGIKREWINTSIQKDVIFYKKVNIPLDVSPVEILFEIQEIVSPYNVNLLSSEDIKTGNIYSELVDNDNKNKGAFAKIELKRDSILKRGATDLCIVLNNLDNYNFEEIKEILKYCSYYTIFLPRNLNRIDLQAEIINSRKEYIISFEIGDSEDYESDFRKSQDINYKINNICNHYQKDKPLILFNPKKLYDFEREIISRLSNCRGNIFSDTNLINLTLNYEGEKKFLELEKELISLSQRMNGKKAFMLNILYSEFNLFLKSLQNLEKKGYRFLSFQNYFKSK